MNFVTHDIIPTIYSCILVYVWRIRRLHSGILRWHKAKYLTLGFWSEATAQFGNLGAESPSIMSSDTEERLPMASIGVRKMVPACDLEQRVIGYDELNLVCPCLSVLFIQVCYVAHSMSLGPYAARQPARCFLRHPGETEEHPGCWSYPTSRLFGLAIRNTASNGRLASSAHKTKTLNDSVLQRQDWRQKNRGCWYVSCKCR
jgi:hypothetical protein